MQTKVCTKCKIEKPVEAFSKYKRSKDGLQHTCKKCSSEYNAKWRQENKQYFKQWREENKEHHKKYIKQWRKENRKHLTKYDTNYEKNRKKTDPVYNLNRTIRKLTYGAFKRLGFTKNSKTAKILGTDFETALQHLIQSAIKNYGHFTGNLSDYHIDHIIPLATAKTEEDIIKLCHYTNLQLLTPEDNLRKGAKLDVSA